MSVEDLAVALVSAAAVLALGIGVRWWAGRRRPGWLSPGLRRSVLRLVLVAAVFTLVVGVIVASDATTASAVGIGVIRWLPRLLLAVLVVLGAIVLARLAAALTERGLRDWSSVIASRMGTLVRVVIVAGGVIIALEQVGVPTQLLLLVVAAAGGMVALALGLGIGLGVAPLARQVTAGRHVLDRFTVGQRVRVGEIEGRLARIGLASSRVEAPDGTVHEIPNELFISSPVSIVAE